MANAFLNKWKIKVGNKKLKESVIKLKIDHNERKIDSYDDRSDDT